VITPAEVVAVLSGFAPYDDGEARKSLDLTRALLEWSPDPFSRSVFTPGHITCTGVVLSPAGDSVLLVHHRRLNRWLLPGGHVEATDVQIGDTARREVLEETGVELAPDPPVLAGCDVHPIPPRAPEPLHLHHDLIFAFRARSLAFTCSPESREVRWRLLSGMDDLPDSIRRSAARAAALPGR
jgi:8-oxo-dGTP pyrophosphatase MutT (NUDIX family)